MKKRLDSTKDWSFQIYSTIYNKTNLIFKNFPSLIFKPVHGISIFIISDSILFGENNFDWWEVYFRIAKHRPYHLNVNINLFTPTKTPPLEYMNYKVPEKVIDELNDYIVKFIKLCKFKTVTLSFKQYDYLLGYPEFSPKKINEALMYHLINKGWIWTKRDKLKYLLLDEN